MQDQKSTEKDEDSHVKKKDKKKDKVEKKKDGKAKKSKHVTPPSKVEELPDPEPVLDRKRRSPSPFGRNTVEPATPTESNMGSLASIKSHSTVRGWGKKILYIFVCTFLACISSLINVFKSLKLLIV